MQLAAVIAEYSIVGLVSSPPIIFIICTQCSLDKFKDCPDVLLVVAAAMIYLIGGIVTHASGVVFRLWEHGILRKVYEEPRESLRKAKCSVEDHRKAVLKLLHQSPTGVEGFISLERHIIKPFQGMCSRRSDFTSCNPIHREAARMVDFSCGLSRSSSYRVFPDHLVGPTEVVFLGNQGARENKRVQTNSERF